MSFFYVKPITQPNNILLYKTVREQKYSSLISDKMYADLCTLDLVTVLISILINVRKMSTKIQGHWLSSS
jgi:hypothetical protein